jgi:N-glycosylase/DNA lyase
MSSLTLSADQPFDLEKTLSCGQVFRWEETGGVWTGVVGDRVIRIHQDGSQLTWDGAEESFIRHYFALDLDLRGILEEIDIDPVIHQAIEAGMGLRIIRQPPWECLASYIIATFTNIPSIKRRISLLCHEFGGKIDFHGNMFHSFPEPGAIAGAEDCRMTLCRLGYRAPFLCETAGKVSGNPGWEDTIAGLPSDLARKELMRYKGVGRKVADCVLLFGFSRLDSVPVDVWIDRIMRTHYAHQLEGRPNYDQIRQVAREYFGVYAGYAQEYLFGAREEIMKK